MPAQIDMAYFCATPFHVLVALTMAASRKETADMYLFGYTLSIKAYGERLKQCGLFRKVKYVDTATLREKWDKDTQSRLIRIFRRMKSYFHVDEIVKEILIPDTVYNCIAYGFSFIVFRWILFFFQKQGMEIRAIQFDDGAGAYSFGDRNEDVCERSLRDKVFCFLLSGRRERIVVTKALFSPALYRDFHPGTTVEIEQIPRPVKDKKTLDILKFVYGGRDKPLAIPQDIIVFDAVKGNDMDDEGYEHFREIIAVIAEKFGRERIYIKKHPRDPDGFHNARNSLPFEVFCLHGDIGNKVLVSFLSTACLTPWLVFGQTPTVILLHRLICGRVAYKGLSAFFDRMPKVYGQPDKVQIPNTLKELRECLAAL